MVEFFHCLNEWLAIDDNVCLGRKKENDENGLLGLRGTYTIQ